MEVCVRVWFFISYVYPKYPYRMIEMQSILIELLENFEFSPPPENVKIIRGAAGLMTPMCVKSFM